MTCGIYKIINKINGKYYLGSSQNIEKRWKTHLLELRNNRHHSIHLQRAWNKYGESIFIFEIVEEVSNEILLETEQHYLNTFTPWNDAIGYNVSQSSSGGDLVSYHPNIDDIKEKHRINTTNRWNNLSDKEKEAYGIKMKGDGNPNWRGGTSFVKFKCPICGKETSTSVHQKSKTCNSCRDRNGISNPFFNKKHSEETKNKLRVKRLGKRLSEETKNKCKEASNNFYNSEEGIAYRKRRSEKISGTNHPLYGIGHTEESKMKMSMSIRQKFIDMTPEQKLDKIINSKINAKMINAEGIYFFNCKDAARYYNKSSTSIDFRCTSTNDKWKSFMYLDKEYIILHRDEILINIKLRLEEKSSDEIDN